MSILDVGEHLFEHRLGVSVGIDRCDRALLGNWLRLWHAVHRSCRAEHESFDPIANRNIDEIRRRYEIRVVERKRFSDAAPHLDEAGEMHDAIDGTVATENTLDDIGVPQRRL